jgi:hypothetical protein
LSITAQPRKQESSDFNSFWTPAPAPSPDPGFAGVTEWGFLRIHQFLLPEIKKPAGARK